MNWINSIALKSPIIKFRDYIFINIGNRGTINRTTLFWAQYFSKSRQTMRVAHCVEWERIPWVFISELYSIKSHSPFGLSPMKQLINDRNNRCDPGTMGFERRQVSGVRRKEKQERARRLLFQIAHFRLSHSATCNSCPSRE